MLSLGCYMKVFKVKYLSFLIVYFFSINAFSYEQIELIWVPDSNTVIPQINMEFDDKVKDTVVPIKTLGVFRTNYKKYRCSAPGVRFFSGVVDRVVYTAFPKQTKIAEGLTLSIGQGYGSNIKPEHHVPSGYVATYSSYVTENTAEANCPTSEYGLSNDIPIPSTVINLPVSINAERAYSGVYQGQIEGRIGLYENFCSVNGTCPDGVFGKDWFNVASAFPVSIPYNVTITSKCSFNTSPINLSHGTMAGRESDGNQTKPYNLEITCTRGTSLSVKLLGTQKVSGKTENYTQCGTGGVCELTFDNGKYDETMTIDNSKILSIKSIYRLNDITKPVAGAFEGSGVLQVLVN